MSIVVNGKTELCDTSKDIMSRKNVNNISGILLLILMACNYNNLSIKEDQKIEIENAFMLVSEKDTTLVTGYGYLFFNCRVVNHGIDTIVLGKIPFDKDQMNQDRNSVTCYLINGDSLPLFSENVSFSAENTTIYPNDSLTFTLSLDSFVGTNSRSKFDSISNLITHIVWNTKTDHFKFKKAESYAVKHIIHNEYAEGWGIKADIPQEYYRKYLRQY